MKSLSTLVAGLCVACSMQPIPFDVYAQLGNRPCARLVQDANEWVAKGRYDLARVYLDVAEQQEGQAGCDPVGAYALLLYEEADSEEKMLGVGDRISMLRVEAMYASALEKLAQRETDPLYEKLVRKMKMLRVQEEGLVRAGTFRSLGVIQK